MSFVCVLHFVMSSCASHFAYVFVSCIRAFSPLSVSQSDAPMPSGVPLLASLRVRVLNFLRMDRALPSGLVIPPVDRLSSFVSFGGRLVLQRLTELARKPLSLCIPTPLPKWPKTHLSPLHALGRSIMIVWAKTAPHLDSPSSLYL